ncbi:putative mannose-6-phosphate 6-reductase [Helianthus annuus]|nr:putative mannose-6-phosphate 6-reductase [Helianthus annuus]
MSLILAADYQNEGEVGEVLADAFKTGLVKREDLFITTKVFVELRSWTCCGGLQSQLEKLQLDYLDLFLVHFPIATKHTGVGTTASALDEEGVLDIDPTISLETTWHAMEPPLAQATTRTPRRSRVTACGTVLPSS